MLHNRLIQECRKELKKRAFEEAISGDYDNKLLCKEMNIDDMGNRMMLVLSF